MRKQVIMFAAIATLMITLLLLSMRLFYEVKEYYYPSPPLTSQQLQELNESKCPSALGISHLIDYKDTQTMTDDDVYITIYNPDPYTFEALVSISEVEQDKINLNPASTAKIKSKSITQWWREGMKKPVIFDANQSEEHMEEQQTTTNQNTYTITVTIEGCDRSIMPFSPSVGSTAIASTGDSSGGGGSSDGPKSRYALSIAKYTYQYLPD